MLELKKTSRTELRRARQRARILHTAGVLIDAKGFEATTIVELADRAEVALATLYKHFESKNVLAVQLAREIWRLHGERMESALGEDLDPAVELAFRVRYRIREALSNTLLKELVFSPNGPTNFFEMNEPFPLAPFFVRGVKSGRFAAPESYELQVALITGAMLGVINEALHRRLTRTADSQTAEYILVLLGLEQTEAHEIARRRLRPLAAQEVRVPSYGRAT